MLNGRGAARKDGSYKLKFCGMMFLAFLSLTLPRIIFLLCVEGEWISKRAVSINSKLKFNLRKSLQIMDTLITKYCKDTIGDSLRKRTRFLASDDAVYKSVIDNLKEKIKKTFVQA